MKSKKNILQGSECDELWMDIRERRMHSIYSIFSATIYSRLGLCMAPREIPVASREHRE